MVGVFPRGKDGRAAYPERLVSLEGVGLGCAKFLLRPSTLLDPLPDNRDLPRVGGSGQALAAMLPGPLEGVCVGMARGTHHVLEPPDHQGVICRVHLGRGAVDTGEGEQPARELHHEHHQGVSGESRWGRSCFQMAAHTSGRLRGAAGVPLR